MNLIRFGRLVNILSHWGMRELSSEEMEELNGLVQPDPVTNAAPVERVTVSYKLVDELLEAMKNKNKIEAIKAYRMLTNEELKESKDAVEKYMEVQPIVKHVL